MILEAGEVEDMNKEICVCDNCEEHLGDCYSKEGIIIIDGILNTAIDITVTQGREEISHGLAKTNFKKITLPVHFCNMRCLTQFITKKKTNESN